LARLRADTLVAASTLAIRLALLDDANLGLDEALRVARREGDRGLEAQALEKLALGATERGALATARKQLEAARAIQENLPDRRALASILDSLAAVVIAQGDYALAAPLLKRSAELYRGERDAQGGAWVRVDQALLALALGQFDAAAAHARAAMSTGEEKQDWNLIAWADIYLGFTCARERNHDDARTHLADALRRLILRGDTRPQILALEGFAALAAEEGDPVRAIRLAAGADAARTDAGFPRTVAEDELLERSLEQARDALAPDELEHEISAGHVMSLEEVISVARDE
jgi:tetratricopeptide (TPR) repeat protein